MVAVAAAAVVVVVVRGGKLAFWSTHLLRLALGACVWGSARILGVSPKGSVGAECVCWACLKIGRESVCA